MENPKCNFCGSDTDKHTTIFTNVKDTKHDLVECQVCHLRFYSPRIPFSYYIENGFGNNEPARKESIMMYENCSFHKVENQELQKKLIKSYYKIRVADKLLALKPDIKTIYEIGGSVGWFSHFLKQDKPYIEVDGCELNKYSVEIANTKFGLNYTSGVFETMNPRQNYYDCLIALDYIEHTFTPYDDMKKMYALVKPGGVGVIKTFLEELDVNRTMEAPIGHSHHFFKHVLYSMIEKVGFKIMEETIENNVAQVIVFFKKP